MCMHSMATAISCTASAFPWHPGGVLALLGRNGAGKTTCISTIIGFLRPRDGEIRLFGEPIGGLGPERISHLGIGLVPQGRRIFPSLTVRENLVVAQQRETYRGQAMECRADLHYVSTAARASRANCGHALGRRTADAGHRARADGKSAGAPARRTVGRPGAADRRGGRPHHPAAEGGRAIHRPGRTEPPIGARCCGSGGDPQHRALRVRRGGQQTF